MIRKFIKSVPFLYSLALSAKQRRWAQITRKGFKNYLSNPDNAKLQLGAGLNVLPGWFNTDYFARPGVFFLDVTKRFPFADNTFKYVFSEHHIEHITYLEAQYMLNEAFRVLEPGGYIKINTPDLDKYLQAYTDKTLQSPMINGHVHDWIYNGFDKAANYIPVDEYYDAHFVNDIFLNYEHRFIYNDQSLKRLLAKAGFINITKADSQNQCHVEFMGIEAHSSEFSKHFTLYIEAQKPVNK